ncbi:hypothetical protein ACFWPU_07740 [Streptomyces sp. NPDC058471]|uniref:hypothetical protein n=1 Tax=Streptomyces sp. NPDC058471 TaxID=3346516 RepID=UPI003669B6CF
MTLMALRPNPRTVNSSWHSSVAALPAERRPATPFHSRLGALHTGLNQHVLRAWNKA